MLRIILSIISQKICFTVNEMCIEIGVYVHKPKVLITFNMKRLIE